MSVCMCVYFLILSNFGCHLMYILRVFLMRQMHWKFAASHIPFSHSLINKPKNLGIWFKIKILACQKFASIVFYQIRTCDVLGVVSTLSYAHPYLFIQAKHKFNFCVSPSNILSTIILKHQLKYKGTSIHLSYNLSECQNSLKLLEHKFEFLCHIVSNNSFFTSKNLTYIFGYK